MIGYQAIKVFSEIAATVSLFGMVIVVCLQVFARFALPSAPAWTEELSRILFVYAVAFGIGVAVDREELVRLSVLGSRLSAKAAGWLERSMQVTVIITSLVLGFFSLDFVGIGDTEFSPVLGIRMSMAFASTSVLMLVVAVLTAYKLFLPFEDKK